MLKLAAIFKDGMILKRNSKVSIWGEADCEIVEIVFQNQYYKACVENGKWNVKLTTGEATCDLSMDILGKRSDGEILDRLCITNICLGEVWLAGGQSNMELELQNSEHANQVMQQADYEMIRFINVPKIPVVNEELLEAEEHTAWKCAKKDECRDMSAVAFYFATKLYEQLNIPIGIIDCYWGGTSATCWTTRQKLTSVLEVAEYIEDWDKVCSEKSEAQYDAEQLKFMTEFNEWQSRVDEIKIQNPDIPWEDIEKVTGPCPWNPPRGAKSPYRPFGLHKTMIERIAPYTLSGVIYYQAEEDAARASYYSKLNTAVIEQWREDFDEPQLPFYITQLPMFIGSGEEDDGLWGVLRLEQENCISNNSNAGIAVISDCGEFNNIHPLDKKTPGHRLANLVLADVYGCTAFPQNLTVKSYEFKHNTVIIEFDNTYGGLCYRESDGNALTAKGLSRKLPEGKLNDDILYGFEVKGADGRWYKPLMTVEGETLMLQGVTNDELTEVKYAMFNYGVANVYSSKDVPLMPFYLIRKSN